MTQAATDTGLGARYRNIDSLAGGKFENAWQWANVHTGAAGRPAIGQALSGINHRRSHAHSAWVLQGNEGPARANVSALQPLTQLARRLAGIHKRGSRAQSVEQRMNSLDWASFHTTPAALAHIKELLFQLRSGGPHQQRARIRQLFGGVRRFCKVGFASLG